MEYEYYYNNVPGEGLSRNNLIYTSLISTDKKVFVQWFVNDSEYHKGKNQVVDPELMDDKFHRELHFLQNMDRHNPDMVPKILEISIPEKKIYLGIDGPDFWNRAECSTENYSKVLPDWQEQMLAIIQAHKDLGWSKFSMHPSSYFVVGNKLKSINYFFTYSANEGPISIEDHLSHIHTNRQDTMRKYTDQMNISWTDKQPLDLLEKLCWESFRNNYPADFIERAKCIK